MAEANCQIKSGFGKSIAIKRKALGLSQKEMADILGMNQGNLAAIELGKSICRAVTMIKIASLLNIDLDRFKAWADCSEEKQRLSDYLTKSKSNIDDEIQSLQEKIKALQEQKTMMHRVPNGATGERRF